MKEKIICGLIVLAMIGSMLWLNLLVDGFVRSCGLVGYLWAWLPFVLSFVAMYAYKPMARRVIRLTEFVFDEL